MLIRCEEFVDPPRQTLFSFVRKTFKLCEAKSDDQKTSYFNKKSSETH